jgi:hypothetical protein
VPDPAVGADLAEALDRLRPLAAQVTLDLEIAVDVLAELRDLLVGEVLDLLVAREPRVGADLLRGRAADAVDVGQPDLEPLLVFWPWLAITSGAGRAHPPNALGSARRDARGRQTTPASACGGGWCR